MMGAALYWYQHLGRSDGRERWAKHGAAVLVESQIDWSSYQQVFAVEDGAIYGLDGSGKLYWHQHRGRSDGKEEWTKSPSGERRVQVGLDIDWSCYRQLFGADDGVIYGVDDQAGLYWHQHLTRSEAGAVPDRWMPTATGYRRQIGQNLHRDDAATPSDWIYKQIFAADDGVIYGVQGPDPKVNGRLYWSRHLGRGEGDDRWTEFVPGGNVQSVLVGAAWNYDQVFAADDDVIYGVLRSGPPDQVALHWYRHRGRSDGREEWANGGKPRTIGCDIAWGDYQRLFAAQDAVIYAIR